MNMKQKLMIFALMIALGTTAVAQPKHRHHAVADTAAVVNNDAATAADKANADEAIEAFSDTTSVAEENSTVPRVYVDDDFDIVSDGGDDTHAGNDYSFIHSVYSVRVVLQSTNIALIPEITIQRRLPRTAGRHRKR